ncbi:caspase domain-containing protein [Amylocystis lapponica]|nr:caspase domain-containing protein [Amylocystis lapponica]
MRETASILPWHTTGLCLVTNTSNMGSRVFALVIGIDQYKSGIIWNLESCADDAQNIKRWLTHDLHVPRDQICLLLDAAATKRNIEDKFMSHLVNNPAIEPGDAILIYFAGHGSTVQAPPGWYEHGHGDVEVLCPFDHDTRSSEGRIAGISDRSLHAMLRDLREVKGDNVTLILDTCCSMTRAREDAFVKRHIRHTITTKATPDDLLSGLWRSAVVHKKKSAAGHGFTGASYDSHVVLAAAGTGWTATEGKAGGNFTTALMTLKDTATLHKLSYADLIGRVSALMDDHQHAVCLGRHTDRILFGGIPFLPDARYVPIDSYDQDKLHVSAGAIHGVMEGTEFSVHQHNRRGSLNPALGTYSVVEVHPTWCLARCKSPARPVAHEGWARITRWNNHTPFRVHIKKSFLSILRRCRLRRNLPSDQEKAASKDGIHLLRVKSAAQADISVKLRHKEMVIERHDEIISTNCRRIIHLPSERTSSDLKIIDAAAHFHLHLHRKNPQRPLLGLVTMELFQLDSSSWGRTSGNLLVDGKAQVVDDGKNSIYAVMLHNYSDRDLWPYLAYMDASGYGITMVYHPVSASSVPPLPKRGSMVIGSGSTDSEALSFSLAEGTDLGAGFLKLFVSSEFTPMTFIEQGPSSTAVVKATGTSSSRNSQVSSHGELWDSVTGCITVIRKVEKVG